MEAGVRAPWRLTIAMLPALFAAGCLDSHAVRDDRDDVVTAVRQRTAFGSNEVFVPDSVNLADGLSEPEAVQLALRNNAAFQELLTDLGLAHADVVQAGLLSNPEFVYIFASGAKSFKYLIDMPVDALVLRPIRARAAGAEWERTRERLTQAGLDLVRDTRLAHADWVLARERVRIAEENLKLRERITTLTEDRLKAGDATPLEVSTAKIDSLRAKQEATRAANDLPVFEERLRNFTGLGTSRVELIPETSDPPTEIAGEVEALVADAIAARPDVLAAQRAIAAADERVHLARLAWLRILGIGDATSGHDSHEFSPGFRVGIPIFNWNQGGVARAEGERERAVRQLETVRERAILETRLAFALHAQAAADYRQWTLEIRPAVELAVRRAENTYKEGGASLLLVLETSRQLIETRAREAQLRTDLIKARAELERSVGRRVPTASGFAADQMSDPKKP
jgi:cobalt-zinc-cadmium efflux system outer membrane protein